MSYSCKVLCKDCKEDNEDACRITVEPAFL